MVREITVNLTITRGLQFTRDLISEETTVNLDTTPKLQFIRTQIVGVVTVNLDLALELQFVQTLSLGEMTVHLIYTPIVGVITVNLDIALELQFIQTLTLGEITVNPDTILGFQIARVLMIAIGYLQSTRTQKPNCRLLGQDRLSKPLDSEQWIAHNAKVEVSFCSSVRLYNKNLNK